MSSWGTPALLAVFAVSGAGTWIAGILVKNDRKPWGLRRDSLLVLLTYLAAVALLTVVPG